MRLCIDVAQEPLVAYVHRQESGGMMRKQWMSVFLLLAMFAVPALAQKDGWASDSDPRVKYIVENERKWAETGCAERPELKDVIADDFQGTAPGGSRFGKQKAIETDLSDLEHDCQLGEVKVRFFGDSLAIAYGSEHSMRKSKDGKDEKRCLVWTDTWLKRAEKWQIIAAQDTAVPCKE